MKSGKKKIKEGDKGGPQATKMPYDTPQLVIHGSVEELTRSSGTGLIDSLPSGSLL